MLRKILYQNQEEIKKDVANLLLEAFPEEERPPLDKFFKSLLVKENQLFAYFDHDNFIGFSYITLIKDVCYLFFLAVAPAFRKQGFGGQILDDIKKTYQDYVILIAFEEVDKKYPNYLERVKRREFYLRHGFINNDLKTEEFGVVYETAYIGSHKVSFETYKEVFLLGFGQECEPFVKEKAH